MTELNLRELKRHGHRLVTREAVHAQVHGRGSTGRFNARLAVYITENVGTMWCAYVFALIGLGSIIGFLTGNVLLGVLGAVSSYFLQLTLLSIIMVGQRVQAEQADARAEADHETIDLLHRLNVTQLEILRKLAAPPPKPKPAARRRR